MTTTTVFSDALDGYIQSSNATYSLARAGSSLAVLNTDVTFGIGQLIFGSYVIFEGFVAFDTSSVPDTDLVSAVNLDVWLVADDSTTDFVIRVKDHNWGTSLTTADWVAGADLSGKTSVTATLNTSTWGAVGAYKTFTGNASLIAMPALKSTDPVCLIIISDREQTGTAPSANEFATLSASEESGTTQDPKLTITHAATTSRVPYSGTPFRVWPRRQ